MKYFIENKITTTQLLLVSLFLLSVLNLIGCKRNEKSDFQNSNKKPNIIFILTDDQRWDSMGNMDQPNLLTPEMDKLASEGVKFVNSYVTSPICAISRASILSGQYANKHNILGFKKHFSDSAYAYTYPMQLKNNGYKIGFIGKYGIGLKKDSPQKYYDYWDCFPGQGKYWHKDSLGNNLHLTNLLGDSAIEFLKGTPNNKPFSLSISFKAPHSQDGSLEEFQFDSTYVELYKDEEFSFPETADSFYWNSFPDFFKKNNEARMRWENRFSTNEKFQKSFKGYYRLIHGVDVQIGKIRSFLKETKQDKNTIIIFMSDNGYYLAEHGMAGKWYAHEESIRVPFILFDPRVSEEYKGLTKKQMILNIDVAPTILDYAGIVPPKTMQGKSIKSILSGEQNSWRNEFLFEHPYKTWANTIPRSEGIITSEWKYVKFLDRKPGYEWLYNTNLDPLEKQNLAENKKYATIKSELKKQFEVLKVEVYKN